MTKNDHFFMLCHEGQLDLPVNNEKWSLAHAVSRAGKLSRNNVVDVKQIGNNSKMKSAET